MDVHLAAIVARFLDRWRVLALATIVAALAWTASTAAIAKPFWHDEIYTILVADLPLANIWGALYDGIDLVPPLSLLLTRASIRLFGMDVISPRLPALVGFWMMTVVVFVMVRARANATLAIIAALIPFETAAYRYSYEARPYGLWMGLFALSLFAWSEAARGRRRAIHLPLLAFTLAASMWTHYYAAFTVAVVCLGEVVRQAVQRRIDWAVWVAFAAAGLAILPLAGLLQVAAEHSSQNFWAQSESTHLREVYWFLLRRLGLALFSAWGAAVLIVLVLSAARERWRARPAAAAASSARRHQLPAHEIAACTATVLIPAVMLLIPHLADRPFTTRYCLPAVVGIALSVPLMVRWANPRGSVAELILCAALLVELGGAVVTSLGARGAVPADPFAQRPLLASALSSPGPVVASGSLSFLQLWYYAPPMQRERLVYLADPLAARQWTTSDTFDRAYLALSRWTAVPVEQYGTFVERNPEFRVYAAGSGWLLDKLHEDGAHEKLLGSESGGRLFRIVR